MNDIIRHIARETIGSYPLSFLKFNTEGSPTRRFRKVLFFCFTGNTSEPALCIKTVRASRDNDLISEGFEKLQTLNRLAEAAGCSGLFPEALALHKEDGIAYALERGASGARPAPSQYDTVLMRHTEFERKLPKKEMSRKGVGERLLQKLEASEYTKGALTKLWSEALSNAPETVSIVPQHGDFTPDNVLVGRDITIVDCDSYLPEAPTGFDLFHFIKRAKGIPRAAALQNYAAMVGLESVGRSDIVLWMLQEALVKQLQGAPRQFAEDLPGTIERAIKEFI